jgi:hypothetical protein
VFVNPKKQASNIKQIAKSKFSKQAFRIWSLMLVCYLLLVIWGFAAAPSQHVANTSQLWKIDRSVAD